MEGRGGYDGLFNDGGGGGGGGKDNLTVSVVEDDDAALLRLGLLGVHHGCAHHKVNGGVPSEAAGDHAEGVLAGQELVGVEHWTNTINHHNAQPDTHTEQAFMSERRPMLLYAKTLIKLGMRRKCLGALLNQMFELW